MKKQKQSKIERALRDLVFIFLGFVIVYISPIMPGLIAGLGTFIIGMTFTLYGSIDAAWIIIHLEKVRTLHNERMKHAKEGVIWIWAVCLVSIFVYSIVWFTLGWAAMGIVDVVTGVYTFPNPATNTITFIRTVFAWHPVLFIIGMLLWAYVNSQRREDITYPAY